MYYLSGFPSHPSIYLGLSDESLGQSQGRIHADCIASARRIKCYVEYICYFHISTLVSHKCALCYITIIIITIKRLIKTYRLELRGTTSIRISPGYLRSSTTIGQTFNWLPSSKPQLVPLPGSVLVADGFLFFSASTCRTYLCSGSLNIKVSFCINDIKKE